MYVLFIVLLFSNLFIGSLLFVSMYRRRKVFQDRFSSVLASSQSGVLCLNISMIIYFLIPTNVGFIAFVTLAISITIGVMFGSLVKVQSILAGCYHGIVGGIMGTMLGAVIEDPTLCSLPAVYVGELNVNMIAFSIFGTILVSVTACLVYYALRI